ncbi:O-antigen polymerase [Clostridium sp. C8-1-8]|uniref:O-antigen polymerase n=1 Tax=Clostridium sp. C8-1-8 TaxID=2698831 RepID=UPI00136FB565|nr:O-antigen polymerase [Clostridium sp. C8-1-8]
MEYFVNFMNYSTIAVKSLMIADILIFLTYLVYKYIKNKYIFSPFNIFIFISSVALLFISMLQYNNKAWEALGSFNSTYYIDYLNQCMVINSIGFAIFILTMALFELFYKKEISLKAIEKDNLIKHRIIVKFYILCLILWVALIVKVWAIPLFGNRMIFDSSDNNKIRPIYLALNIIIFTLAQYMFIRYLKSKEKYLIGLSILGVIVVLLVGSRGPFVDIIVNLTLFYIYSNKDRFRKPNLMIISALALTLVLGIGMLFVRHGNKIDKNFEEKMQQEIMYGNTFSDIRDGAFILYNYDQKHFEGFLNGKNYLADTMSFVPSALSEYRQKWSWGNFTAKTLVGYEDHYGLRGGLFLQPYLNFGWFGVVLIAIIAGIIYGLSERSFYRNIFENKGSFEFKFILATCGITFAKAIFISSGFHDVYPLLVLSFIVLLPKKFVGIAERYKL